ncbi:unnamed protein product [Kuraishia capsulata CBS 1993]|uniref:Major facilitator superfamily (MFS) profile domain-containing protein n=1 Tax=Kuraishia capsulata CBS 1993 TaxID=1382522 RepID=W6MY47_9ASCO|nr:uncharacterized protein KUCA_T00006000001 [Kuraishia capsulata CBS 1993]CDK30005.1 unnamed protein product [Kuraishia capsulata CBS 1993]
MSVHGSIYESVDESVRSYDKPSDEKPQLEQESSSPESQPELQLQKTQTELFEEDLSRELSRHSVAASHHDDDGIPIQAMEWDSATDPENPLNWPKWKKWGTTMTVAGICLVVTLGSSLFVCGVPELMVEMHISETLGLAGLTFYLLGLAFGPAIAAPLSEVFGRKIVYVISLPLSMLFTMGVGLSSHIREILVLRFFAGLIASPAMAIAGGTITDIWLPQDQGLAMVSFCLAPLAGPVVGPVIGGYVAERKGWKWTLWVNLMFAGVLLPFVLVVPETYKQIIMRKRAKKRSIKIQKPPYTFGQFMMILLFITLLKPMQMLVVEPIVMVFSVYIAFVFAVLFGFFEAYPVIFRGTYRMELGNSGLSFLGIGLGLVLGSITFVALDRYVFFKRWPDGYVGMRDKDGKNLPPTPESRLLACKIGAVAMPISLFWLGWTARRSVHWMAPIAAGVPFGFGLVLIFFTVITYFAMSYPPLNVASALAANNLARYVLACVFPLFTVQMYENIGNGWASSIFGFVALAMVPVPWIFEKYGKQLRSRSRFGFDAQTPKTDEEKK